MWEWEEQKKYGNNKNISHIKNVKQLFKCVAKSLSLYFIAVLFSVLNFYFNKSGSNGILNRYQATSVMQ